MINYFDTLTWIFMNSYYYRSDLARSIINKEYENVFLIFYAKIVCFNFSLLFACYFSFITSVLIRQNFEGRLKITSHVRFHTMDPLVTLVKDAKLNA